MTKQDLVAKLAEANDISKKQADEILSSLTIIVANGLAAGDEVTLPGIGKLSVVQKAAREGRNPSTGATIKIPAKKAVKFSVTKSLKDSINTPAKKGKK